MGTLFLTHLCELIGLLLAQYLDPGNPCRN
jgi:hypothetical protein